MGSTGFGTRIGRDTLPGPELLLAILANVGIAVGRLDASRRKRACSEGACPCAALIGDAHSRT